MTYPLCVDRWANNPTWWRFVSSVTLTLELRQVLVAYH